MSIRPAAQSGKPAPNLSPDNQWGSMSLTGSTPAYTPRQIASPTPHLDSLDNFNAQDVLLQQYNRAIRLLHEAEYDTEVSLNQKAQALNSITSVIQAITRLQISVYNAERLKKLEDVLITCIKELPEPHKTDFLAAYELALPT